MPKLRAELLGYHIDNLSSFIRYHLTVGPKTDLKHFFPLSIDCRCPSTGIPSEELTSEQEGVKINIIDKIRREIARFPRLVFLNDIPWDYFRQKEETPELVVGRSSNITVGLYMKNLALLRQQAKN